MSSYREELNKWWVATNGYGTSACPMCIGDHICMWHSARLDDLTEIITQKQKEALAIRDKTVKLTTDILLDGHKEKKFFEVYNTLKEFDQEVSTTEEEQQDDE